MQQRNWKVPKNYSAACALLASMMSVAFVLGPSAHRRYVTDRGPLDAEFLDQAVRALLALCESVVLSESEKTLVRWGLVGPLWGIGDFRRAEELAREVIASSPNPTLEQLATVSLALITKGLPPGAAMDDDGHRTPPVLEHARSPRIEYVEQVLGVHCPLVESAWSPGFSNTTEAGKALNDGEEIFADPKSPHLVRNFGSSRHSPPAPLDIGRASRYLLMSERALISFRALLSPEVSIIALTLEAIGPYFAIDFPETDCLLEEFSCVTRAKSGRIKVARGNFDEAKIASRAMFRPKGSHELFVSPAYVKEVKELVKASKMQSLVLVDDITCKRP